MGRKTLRAAFLALGVGVLSTALPAQDQPPAADKAGPADLEALAWDRDFDLILELRNVPSGAQLLRDARRQELEKERAELRARVKELQARLDALQGTYTSETLLNEMLRQGVSDMQSATKNLKDQIRKDQARIDDLNQSLKRLAAPHGGS